MTDSPALPSENSKLTAEDILQWLKANPRFLNENPEALDFLLPPKEIKDRKVADFQNYMINRLKADKNEAIETAKDIVEVARSNMNNQTRIQRAVLRLLEANSFDEFIQTITHDLTVLLDVDITALVIETNGREIPHINASGIKIVPEGTLDKWLMGKNSLLQSDIGGIEAIYGAGANLVRSQALVRVDISKQTPPCILAFGAREPQFFTPHQGTEAVSFLARVVERLFRSWLLLSN